MALINSSCNSCNYFHLIISVLILTSKNILNMQSLIFIPSYTKNETQSVFNKIITGHFNIN